MTEKMIIDPDADEGGLPKKNMHWKLVLLLGAVVLVAVWLKFGGTSARNTEFKPTPVQVGQLGPAGDPSSIDKAKAEADEKVRLAKLRDQADLAEAKRKQEEQLAQQARQAANGAPASATPAVTPVSNPAVAGAQPNGALPPLPTGFAGATPQAGRAVADPDREAMIRNSPVLVKGAASGSNQAQGGNTNGFTPPEISEAQRKQIAGALDMSSILKNIPGMQNGAAPGGGASANASWLSEYSSKAADHSVQTAYSPPAKYYIRANSLIQAVTTRAINSDLSGPIEMSVVSDVYDTITGTQILIPAGSTISGANNGDIRLGQSRIEAGVGRICRPDGICVDTPNSQGADSSGATGLTGDVNNHFLQIFATAIIPAALAYATTPKSSGSGNVYAGNGNPMNAAGQILTQTSQQVLNRYNNVPPTINVDPGTPVSIVLGKDLVLPPFHR
ncbi:TraB/TrbI/VirB10 family type IV secretion system protein [Ralstonia insidiosa]|jgi:type IV secretion system protein VirB10|nr:TrbI/VirB10 family protein [Ralstonia insidiosa]MBA9939815.1 TrbI/VirB10 family protein [Ralstonia insidiosa]MBC9968482.1 TrbI/VirB10 family protein [Ralstonia insidiosa]MBX3904697.1 TrbI/VirB10 family protein [Ralstonia insidiosa]